MKNPPVKNSPVKNSAYQYSVADAVAYGSADLATLVGALRHWLRKNKANGVHLHDGRVWTYNSHAAWSELFPWLSEQQIKRLLKKLEESGILIKANYNQYRFDRTTWYSINETEFEVDKPEPQLKSTELLPPEPEAENTDFSPQSKSTNARSRSTRLTVFKSFTTTTNNTHNAPANDFQKFDPKAPDGMIGNQLSTSKAVNQEEKIGFDAFWLDTTEIMGGLIRDPKIFDPNMPKPNKRWLNFKLKDMWSKFKAPNAADIAFLILGDWSQRVSA